VEALELAAPSPPPLLASDSNYGNQSLKKESTLKLSSTFSLLKTGNPDNCRGCGRNRDLCFAPAGYGVSVCGHIVAQCLLNVRQALWRYLSAKGWNNASMVDNTSIRKTGSVHVWDVMRVNRHAKAFLTSGSASLTND
jgi:hypothetical protein